MPGPALRHPTCYPASGEARELDFLLINRSLAHCVVDYETGQPGQFPVHCGVKLTLQLAGLNSPVPVLRKARSIPVDEAAEGDAGQPWPQTQPLGDTAQQAWER